MPPAGYFPVRSLNSDAAFGLGDAIFNINSAACVAIIFLALSGCFLAGAWGAAWACVAAILALVAIGARFPGIFCGTQTTIKS